MTSTKDILTVAGREFGSRLFVGTGKFSSGNVMADAIESSESVMVTVALRRIDFDTGKENMIDYLKSDNYLILPNTAGAKNAEEAFRLAILARHSGLPNWIKLEVTPDPRYLLPDPVETLKAAKMLLDEGFIVLPYINADPILAKKLEDIGTAAVMPLAAPIGSNRGIRTKDQIAIIIEQSNVPVVVDAGIGVPSQAAEAMEMGADAVLVNTAIATAANPVLMATAFKQAVIAGRNAYLAGRASTSFKASASSPLTGMIE